MEPVMAGLQIYHLPARYTNNFTNHLLLDAPYLSCYIFLLTLTKLILLGLKALVVLKKLKSNIGIINYYLFTDTLSNFGVCLFIFTVTVLMSQIFRLTELVINKGFGLGETLIFILYFIPSLLTFVIPISLLLSILITMGRMSADDEIIALKASGISLFQLSRPILIVSLIAYLITNLFAIYISPAANLSLKRLVFDIAKNKAEIGIKQRIFNSDFDGITLYVDSLPAKSNRLKGVMISDTRQTDIPSTIIAEEGFLIPQPQEFALLLYLKNGSIHRLNKKQNSYQKIDFKTYNLNLNPPNFDSKKNGKIKKKKEMSVTELSNFAAENKDRKKRYPILVELHSRLAIPFACLVFGLLSVPLGVNAPRSGKSYGFVIGLFLILIYYIFFSVGKNFGSTGVLHPVVAMWMPNLIFLVCAFYLFKKSQAESPILILEKISWSIELIKNKLHVIMEGPLPDESADSSLLEDINTKGKEELMLKLGVGEKRAKAIIDYRNNYGNISAFEELKLVRGIGKKTFEKIKKHVIG